MPGSSTTIRASSSIWLLTCAPSIWSGLTIRWTPRRSRHSVFRGGCRDVYYLEPWPVYIDRAQGAHKWDVDGHELIDYWSGHGALLLGHSHPEVVEAVQGQMARATQQSL